MGHPHHCEKRDLRIGELQGEGGAIKVFICEAVSKLKSHVQGVRALTGGNKMRYFRFTRSVCSPEVVSKKLIRLSPKTGKGATKFEKIKPS